MARTDSKWMPLYIADYLADTSHLNRSQHGSYLLLLMAYWRRGGPLPDDDAVLAQIAKCTPKQWENDKPIIADFFKSNSGLWSQDKADRELSKAAANVKARSEAGVKGATGRWQTHGKRISEPMANVYQTDGPLPSPITTSPNGDVLGARKRAPPAKGTRLDESWQPTQQDGNHAKNLGYSQSDVDQLANQFRDHHLAKGTASKKWDASWRTWVANDLKWNGSPASRGNGTRRTGNNGSSPTSFLAAASAVMLRLDADTGLHGDGEPDMAGGPGDGRSQGGGEPSGEDGPCFDGEYAEAGDSGPAYPAEGRDKIAS
ncbi:Protein of unknown function DUF1376 [uncultured Caudovirales phage]|uniref:DUF1376 domain-containing protein n=1 Tax=uncultured Caudovirales phage TaxID=2100421 RepID=A0A6J5SZ73_9CAUD|nr:Protein of unknown function DUF1376 [uncultured Caudovirales phage]CAB4220715.1 Protein of unknown function DUF1376 [uncultured Caudovirales phage]